MKIDTQEVGRYVEQQIHIFRTLSQTGIGSQFNDGIIEGLNLVKQFIVIIEEREKSNV